MQAFFAGCLDAMRMVALQLAVVDVAAWAASCRAASLACSSVMGDAAAQRARLMRLRLDAYDMARSPELAARVFAAVVRRAHDVPCAATGDNTWRSSFFIHFGEPYEWSAQRWHRLMSVHARPVGALHAIVGVSRLAIGGSDDEQPLYCGSEIAQHVLRRLVVHDHVEERDRDAHDLISARHRAGAMFFGGAVVQFRATLHDDACLLIQRFAGGTGVPPFAMIYIEMRSHAAALAAARFMRGVVLDLAARNQRGDRVRLFGGDASRRRRLRSSSSPWLTVFEERVRERALVRPQETSSEYAARVARMHRKYSTAAGAHRWAVLTRARRSERVSYSE